MTIERARLTPKRDFEMWKYHADIEGSNGTILTEEMIRKWSEDPNRELECTFCGTHFPMTTLGCGRCRTYKGMQPYISEWSNWG